MSPHYVEMCLESRLKRIEMFKNIIKTRFQLKYTIFQNQKPNGNVVKIKYIPQKSENY